MPRGVRRLSSLSFNLNLAPGVARGHSAVSGAIVAASVLSPAAARSGTVLRQTLLNRLADSLSARLVLMIAPGGWGKTSVLQWWPTARDSGVAWLSVGEDDNDPMRFWSTVVASLRPVAPGTGQAALEALTAPGGQHAWTRRGTAHRRPAWDDRPDDASAGRFSSGHQP